MTASSGVTGVMAGWLLVAPASGCGKSDSGGRSSKPSCAMRSWIAALNFVALPSDGHIAAEDEQYISDQEAAVTASQLIKKAIQRAKRV